MVNAKINYAFQINSSHQQNKMHIHTVCDQIKEASRAKCVCVSPQTELLIIHTVINIVDPEKIWTLELHLKMCECRCIR